MYSLVQIFLATEANSPLPGYDPIKSWFELFGLLLLFIFIVVGCYFTTKLVANKQLKQLKHSNFKVIDTYRITQNKFLQIIQIGTRYVVISITKDNITFITELSEEELLYKGEAEVKKEINFKQILSEMTGKNKTNGKG
ncbi:flagellar biosynthetic protein FliO [Lachnoclostridium phytofermentans]|uniref:flagellar biosynthetic protein FliO n=1 Tax=Lachnoclostridium phytofermentans TaxID=66219 RepID=UPI00068B2301|nr:flagellar biosynthetic protein FliO [Lachnoclostridium phytofermentans]